MSNDKDLEVKLAKAEAIKRFRTSVRLECSIAADYVIGRNKPKIERLIAQEVASGGLPALERGMGSKARQLADLLGDALEGILDQLALEPGNDSA